MQTIERTRTKRSVAHRIFWKNLTTEQRANAMRKYGKKLECQSEIVGDCIVCEDPMSSVQHGQKYWFKSQVAKAHIKCVGTRKMGELRESLEKSLEKSPVEPELSPEQLKLIELNSRANIKSANNSEKSANSKTLELAYLRGYKECTEAFLSALINLQLVPDKKEKKSKKNK